MFSRYHFPILTDKRFLASFGSEATVHYTNILRLDVERSATRHELCRRLEAAGHEVLAMFNGRSPDLRWLDGLKEVQGRPRSVEMALVEYPSDLAGLTPEGFERQFLFDDGWRFADFWEALSYTLLRRDEMFTGTEESPAHIIFGTRFELLSKHVSVAGFDGLHVRPPLKLYLRSLRWGAVRIFVTRL